MVATDISSLNKIEKSIYVTHMSSQKILSKVHPERRDIKVDIQNTLTNLDTIINKPNNEWANVDAINAIKLEARIIKGLINFLKSQIIIE